MADTETETHADLSQGSKTLPPRHIVEFDKETKEPQDTALCGYLWDRLGVAHNGEICQECVEEQKRRPKW